MAITRSQLRTSIRIEMKIDRRGKIWSDDEVNEAITDAIDQISVDNDYRWEELKKTWTDTTISAQQEYTLPSDFVTLDLVRVNGVPMESTNYEDLKRLYKTFPTGSPFQYYQRDYKLWLSPIPTTWSIAIDYEYRASAPVMALDTDTMIFRNNMKRCIILQAAFILFGKFSDQANLTRAASRLEKYRQALWEAKKRNALWDIAQIQYKTAYTPRTGSIRTNTARRFGISIS